jgi:hypothetical protein
MVNKHIIIQRDKGILLREWLRDTYDFDLVDSLGDHLKLALDTDPDDGSVVRAYAGSWSNFNENWWNTMVAWIGDQGWDIPGTDGASYDHATWTFYDAVRDTTKKPVAFRRVPVPRDGLYPGPGEV